MSDESAFERRGPGRPRREDAARMENLSRAEQRIREIRASQRELGEKDAFWTPPAPDGFTYNWKRRAVVNMDSPDDIRHQYENGWEAVPRSRHPEMMPPGWPGDTITLGSGLLLMECPTVLVEERRAKDRRDAREAVAAKEQQMLGSAPGQFERDLTRSHVKKNYAAVPIPADE